jgi:hypothetical protein
MPTDFIKIIKLNSSEQFPLDETARAIVLIVEDLSPDESFCEWIENLGVPVILALKVRSSERFTEAAHLSIAAETAEIGAHSADEALKLGLLNKISSDDVEKEALAIAAKISSLAPLAIRACLKAVTEGLKMPLEAGLKLETELFTQIFSTADMREGTSAFLEKRKPVFGNR